MFRPPLEDMARAHSFRLSVEIFATENSTTRFRKLNTGVGRPLLWTPSHCFKVVIAEAFYPLLLMVSHEFSISFHSV